MIYKIVQCKTMQNNGKKANYISYGAFHYYLPIVISIEFLHPIMIFGLLSIP